MADFTVGFLLVLKESAKSFSELLFKLLWTHKKISVCAVEAFTNQGKEFILNSEFVFKKAD